MSPDASATTASVAPARRRISALGHTDDDLLFASACRGRAQRADSSRVRAGATDDRHRADAAQEHLALCGDLPPMELEALDADAQRTVALGKVCRFVAWLQPSRAGDAERVADADARTVSVGEDAADPPRIGGAAAGNPGDRNRAGMQADGLRT